MGALQEVVGSGYLWFVLPMLRSLLPGIISPSHITARASCSGPPLYPSKCKFQRGFLVTGKGAMQVKCSPTIRTKLLDSASSQAFLPSTRCSAP